MSDDDELVGESPSASPSVDDMVSNQVFIRVVDALLSGSAANSQKVYVKVMCGDLDVHTSTAKNRSHCTWGDAFAAAGSESSVRFEVLTKSGFVKQDKSIGSVTVDVSTFSPRVLHKRTFQLNSAGPEVTSCTLQVQLARCTTDEPVHGRVVNFVDACQSAGVQLVGEGGGEGVDSEEEADDALALAAAALRPGDYRIQVHIIKVAELRIVNSKEQVDPVVRVEVLGQTRNTKIHPACLSTVFDDYFTFDFKGLTSEELLAAVVKVTVRDARKLRFDATIGVATFEVPVVYQLPDHEIYQRWAGLINDRGPQGSSSLCGYLNISLVVLGPNDKPKSRVLRDAVAAEEDGDGDSINPQSLVMLPPSLHLQHHFLVISVHVLSDLTLQNVLSKSLDVYVKVVFSQAEVKSHVMHIVKPEGSDRLGCALNEALWLPVTAGMASRVTFSLWDKNLGAKDTLISSASLSYDDLWVIQEVQMSCRSVPPPDSVKQSLRLHDRQDVRAARTGLKDSPLWHATPEYIDFATEESSSDESQEDSPPSHGGAGRSSSGRDYDGLGVSKLWLPLYGAPTTRNTLPSNTSTQKRMNRMLSRGSTYRGKALLSMRIDYDPKGQLGRLPRITALPEMPPDVIKSSLPSYTLAALVVRGSDIPVFGSRRHWGASKMAIAVCIGKETMVTKRRPNEQGLVVWSEKLQKDGISLPKQSSAIPDIFIYLTRKDDASVRVCYARIPAAEVLRDADKAAFRWVELTADPVVNALRRDTYPGSVLIKFGLFRNRTGAPLDIAWSPPALHITRPCQLRVHLYQARHLPIGNRDGSSDPYVVVRCNGFSQKTAVQRNVLHPVWYTTQYFDLDLPDISVAPEVVLQVWDWKRVGDTLLGDIRIPLQSVPVYPSVASGGVIPAPEPVWRKWNLKFDSQQLLSSPNPPEVLFSLQLVEKENGVVRLPPAPRIEPPLRNMFLEFTVIGLRNLLPFQFLPIQKPSATFSLKFACSCVGQCTCKPFETKPSRVPSGTNPNMLERFVMPVRLPHSGLYMPTLTLSVQDHRLYGAVKPVIATSSIPLTNKVPGLPGFSLPCTQPVVLGPSTEDTAGSASVASAPLSLTAAGGVGRIPPDPDSKASSGQVRGVWATATVTGSGTGLSPSPAKSTDEVVINMAGRQDGPWQASRTPFDEIPPYMKGRKTLEGEIEAFFGTAPFESYPLYRGKLSVLGSVLGKGTSVKEVGRFKGIIRVLENATDPPMFDLAPMIQNQQRVKIRVYCLRGRGLLPVHGDGVADPYLKLTLGPQTLGDSRSAVKDTLDPDFFKMYEFSTTLPGESLLKIEAWNRNEFARDELIGLTTIDLEDRWFDPRWVNLGRQPGAPVSLKPVEHRSLWSPDSASPQGSLEMWLDILTLHEASTQPPLNIAPPPPEDFEVRLIIWQTKDVQMKGKLLKTSDMFARAWLEGSEPQKTDIHLRSKQGFASFNFRMKFPVKLPMKFPFLHVQVCDARFVKLRNSCIAELVFDLTVPTRKALAQRRTVNVFRKKARNRSLSSDEGSEEEEESEEEDGEGSGEEGGGEGKDGESGEEKELPDPEEEMAALIGGGTAVKGTALQRSALLARPKAFVDKFMFKKPHVVDEVEDEDDQEGEEGEDDEESEVHAYMNQLKGMTGLSFMPDDGKWHELHRANHQMQPEYRGSLLLSLEILPKADADARPAGKGRSEPNMNPKLPKPIGRLNLKSILLNPFSLISELFGPDAAKKLCYCLTLVGLILVVVMGSPVIGEGVSLFTAAENLPRPANYFAMALIGSVFICLCCCCCVLAQRCKRAMSARCTNVCEKCFKCCRRHRGGRRVKRTKSKPGVEMRRR